KIAGNVVDTVVPFPVRGAIEDHPYFDPAYPPHAWTYVRDWFFLVYQVSFPAMLGLGAGLLALWASIATWRTPNPPESSARALRRFWMLSSLLLLVGGIAVHGARDFYGVGHICLQPLALLGLTAAALALPRAPTPIRVLAAAGMAIDAAAGIL